MFGMMEMSVLASVEGSESMMMGAASFWFALHAGIATAARINSRIRERMNAST
jgi:translation initiation factor IF-1